MEAYSALLAVHLSFVIIWITILVYMQRLILLQVKQKNDLLQKEVNFIYKYFANPTLLGALVFGVMLLSMNKTLLESGIWIYAKFFFISLMMLMHHLCKKYINELKNDSINRSETYFKYFSYLPLVFICIVVILTIIKPF